MASAEVSSRPQELPKSRKPFSQWVRGLGLGTLKGKNSDAQKKNGSKKTANPLAKHKKNNTHNGTFKNNPYPESGHLNQQHRSPASSVNGQLSFATSRPPRESCTSSPRRSVEDRPDHRNKSGAPTLATNPDTLNSDTSHSKAATTTTRGGALSSTGGQDSTFSSPNQSQRSLTTTLTTIQSTSAGNALQNASGNANATHHGSLNNPNPGIMFSHQFPVSPAPSGQVSAIPRHVQDSLPNTASSAGASNLLTDNASIMTLASSSKRRRRSMDTDASVHAMAPSSVWGGSRESLPLSVLSGNTTGDAASGMYPTSHSRPSMGLASAERASVYSSSVVTAPALASERNSYYSKHTKDFADAKSLRSITNIASYNTSTADDAKSTMTNGADSKSLGGDVGSLRNYEASVKNYDPSLGKKEYDASIRGIYEPSVKGYEGSSVRSGQVGHARNDSLPGSVGSPLASPRHMSAGGPGLSRRSSDWGEIDRGLEHDESDHDGDPEAKTEVSGSEKVNEKDEKMDEGDDVKDGVINVVR